MSERHELELDGFGVAVIVDDERATEVVFSRAGKPVFRAGAPELREALSFVEKHGDISLVLR